MCYISPLSENLPPGNVQIYKKNIMNMKLNRLNMKIGRSKKYFKLLFSKFNEFGRMIMKNLKI